MAKSKDQIIKELLDVVKEKKAEIAKAERPTWETNCSFSFTGGSSDRTNIQVTADVDVLVSMLAHLYAKSAHHSMAAKELGVETEFKHQGFTLNQWKSDFQTRINKIQIAKKKTELENLELRLNLLVSPEERERLELEELAKSVGKL